LQLANTLYGPRPPAWQLLGDSSRHGPFQHELTPATKALLPELLAAVASLVHASLNWP